MRESDLAVGLFYGECDPVKRVEIRTEKGDLASMEKVGLRNLRDFLSIRITEPQRGILHTSNARTFFQSFLGFWYSRLFLIRLEGQPAGYLFLFCNPYCGKYNIGRLVIDLRFQRRGIGKTALLWGVEKLKTTGADRVLLSVHPNNIAALNLYKSVGFAFTGSFWGDEAVMKLEIR